MHLSSLDFDLSLKVLAARCVLLPLRWFLRCACAVLCCAVLYIMS